MADETRVQVLKEPGRPATSDKFMWVTRGGPPGEQSILFEYDPSRSGNGIHLRKRAIHLTKHRNFKKIV